MNYIRDVYTNNFTSFSASSNEKELICEKIKYYTASLGAKSLLDIGAGNGVLAQKIKPMVSEYLAIEPNPVYADNLRKLGVDVQEQKFPCKINKKFDIVLLSHVISFKSVKFKQYLIEARKLLSEKGLLILISSRGDKNEWTDIIVDFDKSYVQYGEKGFEQLKFFLRKQGSLWRDDFKASLKAENINKLIDKLSFLYGDGNSERTMKIASFLKENKKVFGEYKKDSKYIFPLNNYVLIWNPLRKSKKKKVFVLGDIGRGENGYFHIGDEAMFEVNRDKYLANGYQVFGSSRSMSHPFGYFYESEDIYISSKAKLLKCFILLFLKKIFRIDLFSKSFSKTLNNLKACSVLHISGGGNLNNIWPGHLYYRFFMIVAAKLWGLKVVLQGQTLGPVDSFGDKLILKFCLKLADEVSVRDCRESFEFANTVKKVKVQIDDAYFLKSDNKLTCFFQKQQSAKIKIGLSLHSFGKDSLKKISALFDVLSEYQADIYCIPHVLADKNSDIDFMRALVEQNKFSGKIFYVDRQFLSDQNIFDNDIAKAILSVYENMDAVISTRYHGVVFGLMSAIPTIALNYDNYYQLKNRGFIDFYGKEYQKFAVDIENKQFVVNMKKLIGEVIKKRKEISQNLKKQNLILNDKYGH